MSDSFSRFMKGVIAAFRGNHHAKYMNHTIVKAEGVENKEAAVKLEGKKVLWKNPIGKKKVVISGYVSKAHGGKGAMRIVFERGLPGQCLGTQVEIE